MANDLVFIKSDSGSLVTELDLPNCFSDRFQVYYLTASLNTNGGQGYGEAQLLDSGGSVLSGLYYDRAALEMPSNSSYVDFYGASTDRWRDVSSYQDDGKGYGFSAYIYTPFDSSAFTYIVAQSSGMTTANTIQQGIKFSGVYRQASSVYGIRLRNSTPAPYEYIKASIYGVK